MATGLTSVLSLPFPLPTDQVNVSGDIEQLATKLDNIFEEETQDISAAMWTGGTFSNGINAPTYNDTTGKMSMSLTQDLQTTASPQFVGLTLTGDIDVQGGDITTNQTTFNFVNVNATTLNIGGAATTINIGSSSGVINSSSDLNLSASKEFKINNTSILSATTLGSSVIYSSLTSVGTITSGTWSGSTIATNKGGTGLTSFTENRAIYADSTSSLTSGILPLAAGGTNSSLTASSGSIIYSTSSGLATTSVGSPGQVLISNGTSAPSWTALPGASEITLSGDATGSGTSAITVTLSNTGVTAATYGSATSIPVISVDAKGRITSASNQSIDIDPLPQIFMMAGM